MVGSLTEARGQKANIHVLREMLQLCEVIDSGGFAFDDENPDLKVIPFGELFNVRSSINMMIIIMNSKHFFIDF